MLDSSSCVMQGLVYINKKVVYGSHLIKKSHYWPLYIDDNNIKDRFSDKDVGDMDALYDYLDIVILCVFTMKKED